MNAKRFGQVWLTAGLLVGLLGTAGAQTRPATAVEQQLAQERFTLVAPFPPGGPIDTLARLLSEGLQRKYGQPAVVDNAVGAAGNIGMDKVKRARADGHTLLVIPAGNLTINPTLMPQFPFQVEKDFTPITMLAKAPNVLLVHPSLGAKSAKELVALAKAKPDSLSYASPGVGSGLHLAGELFKDKAGVDIQHVPYKGTTPALNDLLGGTVPIMFSNLPATLAHIRSGRLLALGVTDDARTPIAPEIPTLAEQGIDGVVVTSWYGLLAPAGTPAPVVEQLARDASDILNDSAVLEKLRAQGLSVSLMAPQPFAQHIRRETASWAKVIKSRNITAQ